MNTPIQEWVELSAQLRKLKKKEADLRREICAEILDGSEDQRNNGRLTVKEQIDGYAVKAVSTTTYKVDPRIAELWTELSVHEKVCIRWKPELDMRKYNALENRQTLDYVVTSNLGMPTLEAKEPED